MITSLSRSLSRSLALAAALAGCAARDIPPVRFANAPAVDSVDDRRDVPRRPERRAMMSTLRHTDGYLSLATRPLALPRPHRARGVNALDEVPDSTWFTNRIGVRDLSPDEIRTGPARIGSPEPHMPWTIHSTKIGGRSIGFVISDARGEKFLLKFDEPAFPEMETGADAITSRLLWAAGFNVPEDHIVYLRPHELVLAPDAKIKDPFGNSRHLGRAELERRLALVHYSPGGRIRGLASRLLDGTPLGGHPSAGVRKDDPNDRIPHELRRDLRGSYTLFAWLDQTDVKEDNTLDMWVTDPADPSRHYVKHYLIDFGKSLGATATTSRDPRRSHAYKIIDVPQVFSSFVTLGLRPRQWERRADPALPGVGMFEAETFDPSGWKPDAPDYLPFRTADDLDKLWASKILIRFTREQIRAAVETARFTDPRATEYITDTLVARQRITARHWFWRASPLDRFAPAPGTRALCFDDLMILHRLAPVAAATRYTVTAYDRRGDAVGGPLVLRATSGGRTCTGPLALAAGGDDYTIVRLDTARLGVTVTVYVHLARDPSTGAPRVIGIWRP